MKNKALTIYCKVQKVNFHEKEQKKNNKIKKILLKFRNLKKSVAILKMKLKEPIHLQQM